MKIILAILGVIALLVLRSALQDTFHKVVTEAATDHSAACLSLAGSTTREVDGFTYIVGSVRNNCDRKFSKVTIGFKLDRPAGSGIGLPDSPVFASSDNVQPHETRNFKTLFRVGKNSTYRFSGITAF